MGGGRVIGNTQGLDMWGKSDRLYMWGKSEGLDM